MDCLDFSDAHTIDLNADLGEGFPWDEALLDRVTSASICCGAHAGGREESARTLLAAQTRGVVVGAHPGYADRDHFGRRELTISGEDIASLVRMQVEWLAAIAEGLGVPLRFVKPHGALYNQGQRQDEIASGIVAGLRSQGTTLALVGQPESCLARAARDAGLRYLAEGFADRRYQADGRLIPRSEPGAILSVPDEIEAQVLRLVDQGIDTLCLHGDDPRAVGLADFVRGVLNRAGVRLASPLQNQARHH